jgi:hypothetical protein
MKLRRIVLGNWKNFREVDVRVPDRLFLVGANASGKSNFLDAIQFLCDVAFKGGIKEAVSRRGGVLLKNWEAPAHEPVHVQVEVEDYLSRCWTYSLTFDAGAVEIVNEYASCDGEVLLSRPDKFDRVHKKRLTYSSISTERFCASAGALLDFFSSVTLYHDVIKFFWEVGLKAGNPMGGFESKWERIEEAFHELVPTFRLLPSVFRALQEKYATGEPYFSRGTCNLLGMLWETLTGKGLLLLESPEVYLHQTVVEKLPHVLRRLNPDRQWIMSTYASRLLQDEGIGLDEVLVFVPSAVESVTRVVPAAKLENVRALVEGGHTIGEAVMPITE